MIKVLVGCEESQVVTQAFRKLGHDAISCDLQPTRGNPDYHIQGDIIKHLLSVPDRYYDLIILHPDCTAMALSGNRYYGKNMIYHDQREKAINWTCNLWSLAKKKCISLALENPKSVIFPVLRGIGVDVQYVQPWMFGHTENKETGFALHNLPRLKQTHNVKHLMTDMDKAETDKIHRMPPGPNRKRDRSVTYQGIADAIADQWSSYILERT